MENLSESEIITLLKDNYIGHLSYIAQGRPFTIPITYFYDLGSNAIISYSAEGHKMEAMRKNGAVSLEVEEIVSNSNWQSVLAHGTFDELHGSDAKYYLHQFTEGVKNIIKQKEQILPEFISEFSSKSSSKKIPVEYRIKILEITGRRKEA